MKLFYEEIETRLTGAVTEKGVSNLECGVSKAERERECEWKEEEKKFDCFLQSKLERLESILIYWAWSVSYMLGRSLNLVCL